MDDVRLYAACNASILEETEKCIRMRIIIFKIFIWLGISLDIRSEITFYDPACVSL